MLSMLELEMHQIRKLQLTDILEITKQSMNDQMPQTQGGLPWHLLRKVMGLHGMTRSMSLRNGRSASIQTSVDGDDLVISDNLFSLVEMDRSDSSHPLFAFLRSSSSKWPCVSLLSHCCSLPLTPTSELSCSGP